MWCSVLEIVESHVRQLYNSSHVYMYICMYILTGIHTCSSDSGATVIEI